MISGILLLNKPAGITSHDVVDTVRKAAGQKKVGHGGTLDPPATGLLVILLGKATRLLPFLGGDKVYEGTITFGVATDTLDAGGKILSQNPVKLALQEIQTAAAAFIGEIEQIPPMVSAVKVGGTPLHKLARAGKEVERESRRVRIDAVELLSFDESGEYPTVDFRVVCSGGTYIRVLAADIGERLGCAAHLSRLVRTGSGRFRLDDAVDIESMKKLEVENRLGEKLIPLADALDLPELVVDGVGKKDVAAGRPVRGANVLRPAEQPLKKNQFVKVIDTAGELLCVAVAVIDILPDTGSITPPQEANQTPTGVDSGAVIAKPKTVLI